MRERVPLDAASFKKDDLKKVQTIESTSTDRTLNMMVRQSDFMMIEFFQFHLLRFGQCRLYDFFCSPVSEFSV